MELFTLTVHSPGTEVWGWQEQLHSAASSSSLGTDLERSALADP